MNDPVRSPLLEMTGIAKSYGAVPVLQDVSLAIHEGESVALIGENGAGKSTFCRILTGVLKPDHGRISLKGQPVTFGSPRDALMAGLAFIPQELAYVPQLSVAENILLNRWRGSGRLVRQSALRRRAEQECHRFGIDLDDLSRPMSKLRLAERQIVEIVKALSRNSRLIVLDEPTAALSAAESDRLFGILDRLNGEGVGILYISHRMDEVFSFSDRVAVLRNGRMVAVRATVGADHEQLIADMLGQDVRDVAEHEAPTVSPEAPSALSLRQFGYRGLPQVEDVSLDVYPGEILGLYGVRGSGVELVAEALGGLRPQAAGALRIGGYQGPVFGSPLAARRAGVAYVPAERKINGLVLQHSIGSNLSLLILRRLSRFGVLRRRTERQVGASVLRRFDVRCRGLDQAVGKLSGGNQQKVLLASRLAVEPKLLVLHEPTRGVDIGARAQIHDQLRDTARAGLPTLMVTSDLEEAVALSDRLLVMRQGRLVGMLAGTRKTQQAAVALAAGQEKQDQ